ncbi:MAG: hypothetical protein ACK4YD_09795 [Chitinophagia bacterium]|jgi:hypothetical protein
MQYIKSVTKKFDFKWLFLQAVLLVLFVNIEAQPWLDYKLTPRGDTINRLDKSKRKQGPWVIRLEEVRGEPGYEEEGYFYDDKKEGPWRRFSLMGDLIARENYKGGYRDGKQQYYTRTGDLLRDESWKSVDPSHPYDTIMVPDLDQPDKMIEKIIKHEAAEVKNGLWTHYDPNTGDVMKTERFIFGQPEKSLQRPVADKSLPAKDTSSKKAPQKIVPKEVQQFDKKKKGKG